MSNRLSFNRSSRLQKIALLEDALKLLESPPGTVSKSFTTFGSIRREFSIDGRTRPELIEQIKALHKVQ